MLYSGVDLIEIARVADAIARHGDAFLRRVFTPNEIAYCKGRVSSLAARFAAKEAAAKALGTGFVGLGGGAGVFWTDVEIVNDALGKPSLQLHRGAAQRAAELGWRELSLSYTHERTHAAAVVVAVGYVGEAKSHLV